MFCGIATSPRQLERQDARTLRAAEPAKSERREASAGCSHTSGKDARRRGTWWRALSLGMAGLCRRGSCLGSSAGAPMRAKRRSNGAASAVGPKKSVKKALGCLRNGCARSAQDALHFNPSSAATSASTASSASMQEWESTHRRCTSGLPTLTMMTLAMLVSSSKQLKDRARAQACRCATSSARESRDLFSRQLRRAWCSM